ncbi:hypothetical protein CsatB_029979 [Cannabis sativa]
MRRTAENRSKEDEKGAGVGRASTDTGEDAGRALTRRRVGRLAAADDGAWAPRAVNLDAGLLGFAVRRLGSLPMWAVRKNGHSK